MKRNIKIMNIVQWLRGYKAGRNSTLHADRELQEQWQLRVLNGSETYESFWVWWKGYKTSNKL